MMKFYKGVLILALASGMLTGCEKNLLVFPPQIQEQVEEQDIVIAGPSNVVLSGTYDLKFKIEWRGVSDRVEKAIITYKEGGEDKRIEVTDFSKDHFIQGEKIDQYLFSLQYVGKDGTLSKVVQRTATNKIYLVDYLIDHFELSKTYNKLQVVWDNDAHSLINADVSYVYNGKEYMLRVDGSTKLRDTLQTIGLTAGQINFQVKFSDAAGRSAEKDTVFQLIDHKYVTAQDKENWIITASNQHSAALGADKLIDGITDSDNHWHTDWYPDPAKPETVFPHEVEITLAEMMALDGFTLYNRTGGSSDGVKTFDVYVREKFEDEYEKVASDLIQVTERGQNKNFSIEPTKPIKMVKFVFKDAWPRNGEAGQYAHLAEIDLKGIVE